MFQKACASCHAQPAPDSRAPTREVLRAVAPEAIVTALTVGQHVPAGIGADRRRTPRGGRVPLRTSGRHASARRRSSATAPRSPRRSRPRRSTRDGTGGARASRTRDSSRPRKPVCTAAAVPRLKLKWAYGFPGVNNARSQPAVLGGRLFVASDSGDVVALDAKTRLHVLELSRAGRHPHGGQRRAVQDANGDQRLRGLLRRRRRDRLRRRCRTPAARSGGARLTTTPTRARPAR